MSTSPIGSHRSAERLSERTGLRVKPSDIDDLVAAGVLTPTGEHRGFPIFRLNDLDRLTKEAIAEVVERRQAWRAESKSASGALELLGWNREDFQRITAEKGITAGPLGRYALVDLEALAAEPVDVAGPMVTLDGAAERLGVRRLDLDFCVAAGWLRPHMERTAAAGRSKGATVAVPMFLVSDVDALLTIYGVDWAEVRAAGPGLSPLAEATRFPVARASAVRKFCADYADYYGVELRAQWEPETDLWVLDWDRDAAGEPTVAQVEWAIGRHSVQDYWTDLELRDRPR